MKTASARSEQSIRNALTAASAGALILVGLRKGGAGGLLMALGGAGIFARKPLGRAWKTVATGAREQVDVTSSLTILRDQREVFDAFRSADTLDRVCSRLERLSADSGTAPRWRVKVGPMRLTYRAELAVDDAPDKLTWVTLPDSDLIGGGDVSFRPAPGDRGTEVRVHIRYAPNRARPARLLAHALRRVTRLQLYSELSRMRQLLEAGEVATNRMRPEGAQEEGAMHDESMESPPPTLHQTEVLR